MSLVTGMEIIDIGEPVRVNVTFEPLPCLQDRRGTNFPHHKVKPCSFFWRNREYPVQEITYVWREAIGEALIYHFAVTEGANVFELCFNSTTMDWVLKSVAHE